MKSLSKKLFVLAMTSPFAALAAHAYAPRPAKGGKGGGNGGQHDVPEINVFEGTAAVLVVLAVALVMFERSRRRRAAAKA